MVKLVSSHVVRRDVNVAEFLRVALANVVNVELNDVLETREEHLQQSFPVPATDTHHYVDAVVLLEVQLTGPVQ